jgi:prepilin-type N-terminal cleavage/methylation domain-containing protein
MQLDRATNKGGKKRAAQSGFTLIEVVFAAAIAGLLVAGMFQGYNMAGRRAQFAACSLAANATAMRQLEQCLAADWVPSYGVTNLLSQTGSNQVDLCLPVAASNVVNSTVTYGTTLVSSSPYYAMISVTCVWTMPAYGGTYTNIVSTLRAPNQ